MGMIQKTDDHSLDDANYVDIDDGRCAGVTRAGTRCSRPATDGTRYCTIHRRPAMIANRHEDAGRYTTGLPAAMVAEYQTALQDRYLLHLRDEIAVITTRINHLLTQTDVAVNASAWKEIKQVWERMKRATRKGDQDAIDEAMLRLTELIDTGKRESDIWIDIERLFEQRRRLVETEQKYLRTAGQTLTIEAAMVLLAAAISAIKESVRKYVGSREVQEAIIVDAQYEYSKLVGAVGNGEGA
jgi:hypothetical protein